MDLVGVFTFSAYGAYRALQARMDTLGAFVCGGLVALGGGTIREMVLHGTPRYLRDYRYALMVVLATGFAILLYRRFDVVDRYLLLLDGVGLATFALFGASRAAEEGFGVGAMMLCAALTAAGGGVICDLMTGRRPQLFYSGFYAVPALLMAILARLFRVHLANPVVAVGLIAVVFAVHLGALRLRWKLWRPVPPIVDLGEMETVRMSRSQLIPPVKHSWNDETVQQQTVFRSQHACPSVGADHVAGVLLAPRPATSVPAPTFVVLTGNEQLAAGPPSAG
jgi:uncharacterized membrane protein YeiH